MAGIKDEQSRGRRSNRIKDKERKRRNYYLFSIEEVKEMLEKMAMDLPQELYDKLNGGILLLPEIKRHPEGTGNDLYILGQYHYSGTLGRYITIFYGSFLQVHGHLPKELFYEELRKTLIHEFTHHIESLAGERTLVEKDIKKLQEYKRGLKE